MQMHEHAMKEMRELEKQIAKDNRKLEAMRMVIREYATDEFPGTAKMNTIITECINKHGGAATLQQIVDCISDHQIMIPRNRLSLLLTKSFDYDRPARQWRLLPKDE